MLPCSPAPLLPRVSASPRPPRPRPRVPVFCILNPVACIVSPMGATKKTSRCSASDYDHRSPEIWLSALVSIFRIASETFQHTGSFKFRAAYNLAAKVSSNEIVTASSGNFGAALAYSCQLLGKRCTVVMPDTSARVKIDNVRDFGATVDLINVREKSRAERVQEIAAAKPDAYIASAYDDPLVIEGNSSLGFELASSGLTFDTVIAPVGGGGLTSGLITAFQETKSATKVAGAEPLAGNDAARSLKAGRIVTNESEPETLADGARTVSIGRHNWEILKDGISTIIEVPEELIAEGVRLLFRLANLKAEPTSALSIGALLASPETFRGRSVCCVVTGANVDEDLYRKLLSEPPNRLTRR